MDENGPKEGIVPPPDAAVLAEHYKKDKPYHPRDLQEDLKRREHGKRLKCEDERTPTEKNTARNGEMHSTVNDRTQFVREAAHYLEVFFLDRRDKKT